MSNTTYQQLYDVLNPMVIRAKEEAEAVNKKKTNQIKQILKRLKKKSETQVRNHLKKKPQLEEMLGQTEIETTDKERMSALEYLSFVREGRDINSMRVPTNIYGVDRLAIYQVMRQYGTHFMRKDESGSWVITRIGDDDTVSKKAYKKDVAAIADDVMRRRKKGLPPPEETEPSVIINFAEEPKTYYITGLDEKNACIVLYTKKGLAYKLEMKDCSASKASFTVGKR